ncbi:MAG: T9SS type A sorting domain-containing protein [Candidatus Krumholzibacteriota bacterium]|nr:T9SS type A sorting domain-containing protein [Candidatus Krumholzibacteriota bacterium]
MKRLSSIIPIVLCIVLPAVAVAGVFSDRGLEPVVVIVENGDADLFARVRAILEREGAGIQLFPPSAALAHAPAGIESAFAGLPVRVERTPEGLAGAGLDAITHRLLAGRLAPPASAAPLDIDPDYVRRMLSNDIRRPDPAEIARFDPKIAGPNRLSAGEMRSRAPDQNSEFLIGSVVVNVIFAESDGPIENWTDQEIADALLAISNGLDDYQQKANWAGGVEFTILYADYVRAGTTWEPIVQGNMGDDHIWIGEVFASLGMDPMYGAYGNAHLLNEATRNAHGTDWAFTAVVVDASTSGCWQHEQANYVAYSYLGGPYLLVPYPACRFGSGDGFSHVFDHEMGHTFWALDEYEMQFGNCGQPGGYLAIANNNAHSCYDNPLSEQLPCIMNNRPITRPLPICMYTAGQIGLWDENENSIVDLYEIAPTVQYLDIPGIPKDTIYTGNYVVAARAWNDPVENENPEDWEGRGVLRLHYAPRLARGWYWINNGITEDLNPSDRAWDESREEFGFLFEGLEPGYNTLNIRVENHVGLRGEATEEIYYIGLRYYQVAVNVDLGFHEITWKTAEETFGASFDLFRRDLTAGGGEELLATITESASVGGGRRHFVHVDDDIEPGHEYFYRVVGSFELDIDGEHREFEYSTDEFGATAMMPLADHLASHIVPNPTPGRTSFTVNVPRTFHDPTNNTTRVVPDGGISYARAATELRTHVDIGVYDVTGRRIATVYDMLRFGGPMTIAWDGIDRNGRPVTPGVYFMRIKAGNEETTRKLVILR